MPESQDIALQWIHGEFAVCRLRHDAEVPTWLLKDGSLLSLTRTSNELSIVTHEQCVPSDVTAQRGWRAMRVAGTLDFSLVGILAKLSRALADAGVSVFVISTYDTDYLLVRADDAGLAVTALAAVADVSALH